MKPDHTTVGDLGAERSIMLYVGDLAALPAHEAVDILVVSAFPNDYVATPRSLIGALHRDRYSGGSSREGQGSRPPHLLKVAGSLVRSEYPAYISIAFSVSSRCTADAPRGRRRHLP